ncbi:MAG: IS5 family transposase [Ignavibacteriae bacterium]|nr:IS5 family transposase [Ignavibacteriota bacterium]
MATLRGKKTRGFFDYEFRQAELKKRSNPLEKLDKVIDWEIFRSLVEEVFAMKSKGTGGAPAYDRLMMFKILVLQRYYNLSDEQTEFQIKDRISFQTFLGLSISDDVPDQNTIWEFRERLTEAGVMELLFNRFEALLDEKGIMGKEGSLVDASFVEVPRQRNSREENKLIKEGKVPEEWESNPNKLSQKDTDAKWTKKNNETHYGYKNHVKADRKTKLVCGYKVTDASVHDSQTFEDLLEKDDQELYADSAYRSAEIEELLDSKKIKSQINEKGYRNNPLTEKQKDSNREKSRVRARVEHIFAFIENTMNGSYLRYIGLKRTEAAVGMMNLVYNLFRYEQIKRLKLVEVA